MVFDVFTNNAYSNCTVTKYSILAEIAMSQHYLLHCVTRVHLQIMNSIKKMFGVISTVTLWELR